MAIPVSEMNLKIKEIIDDLKESIAAQLEIIEKARIRVASYKAGDCIEDSDQNNLQQEREYQYVANLRLLIGFFEGMSSTPISKMAIHNIPKVREIISTFPCFKAKTIELMNGILDPLLPKKPEAPKRISNGSDKGDSKGHNESAQVSAQLSTQISMQASCEMPVVQFKLNIDCQVKEIDSKKLKDFVEQIKNKATNLRLMLRGDAWKNNPGVILELLKAIKDSQTIRIVETNFFSIFNSENDSFAIFAFKEIFSRNNNIRTIVSHFDANAALPKKDKTKKAAISNYCLETQLNIFAELRNLKIVRLPGISLQSLNVSTMAALFNFLDEHTDLEEFSIDGCRFSKVLEASQTNGGSSAPIRTLEVTCNSAFEKMRPDDLENTLEKLFKALGIDNYPHKKHEYTTLNKIILRNCNIGNFGNTLPNFCGFILDNIFNPHLKIIDIRDNDFAIWSDNRVDLLLQTIGVDCNENILDIIVDDEMTVAQQKVFAKHKIDPARANKIFANRKAKLQENTTRNKERYRIKHKETQTNIEKPKTDAEMAIVASQTAQSLSVQPVMSLQGTTVSQILVTPSAPSPEDLVFEQNLYTLEGLSFADQQQMVANLEMMNANPAMVDANPAYQMPPPYNPFAFSFANSVNARQSMAAPQNTTISAAQSQKRVEDLQSHSNAVPNSEQHIPAKSQSEKNPVSQKAKRQQPVVL